MRGSQTPALLLRSLSPVSITLTPACQSDLTAGLLTLLKVWALVSFDLGPLPAPGIKANWVQVSLCSLGLLIHHLFSLSGFMYLSSLPGFFAEEKPMREERKGRGGGRQQDRQTDSQTFHCLHKWRLGPLSPDMETSMRDTKKQIPKTLSPGRCE